MKRSKKTNKQKTSISSWKINKIVFQRRPERKSKLLHSKKNCTRLIFVFLKKGFVVQRKSCWLLTHTHTNEHTPTDTLSSRLTHTTTRTYKKTTTKRKTNYTYNTTSDITKDQKYFAPWDPQKKIWSWWKKKTWR